MLKRIITSAIALCVLIPILWFSDTWVFPIALSIVSVLALYEISACVGIQKQYAVVLPLYAIGLAMPIVQKLLDDAIKSAAIGFILAIVYTVYLFGIAVFFEHKRELKDFCVFYTFAFYIMIAMNMIYYIRNFSEKGKYIYLLIFIGAWITDVFAYFVGVFFGKHKLIERVSPKKTIEGSIGGIVFCSVAFVLTGVIIASFFEDKGNVNYIFLAVSGVLISVIAQIGDLILSLVKRIYGIKDFGKIFPGHGGILDRFDSILAVTLGVAAMCIITQITQLSLF